MTPSPPRAVYLSSDSLEPPVAEPPVLRCDGCERLIEGEPGGHGTYLRSREGEISIETVPLCSDCATAIGLAAQMDEEDEEEG